MQPLKSGRASGPGRRCKGGKEGNRSDGQGCADRVICSEGNIHEVEVRSSNCFYLVLSSAISNVEQDLPPVTAPISALPFINPPLAPAPAPVDFALPFDFSDDLAWLDNLGFMSETSQPLNGGGDFTAASSQLDWNARGPVPSTYLLRPAPGGSISKGGIRTLFFTKAGLPILPPPPVSSPYSSPTALQVISPAPIEVLNTDVDERNIVHFSRARSPTKCALETVGTVVQSKAKKTEE
ncbi:hypothetical protein B0H14DRAFT_3614314 [Mycena olivaceomarginata]|nr:hypothetical protein B0H14DRAFT_3614314 [Mycena olivaceomarginata]